MNEPRVLSETDVATLVGCTTETVQEKARAGILPGLKLGVSWVFPAGALARVLDELALEEAAKRKKTPEPAATTGAGKKARKLPVLPVLGDGR